MGVLTSIVGVSFLTLVSRWLGLLRDIFIFSTFGTSELNSAFLLAFSVPNLFRRLLGEGALTSALVPVFSDEYHQKGKEEAFFLLNGVASRLIIVLFLIVVGGILLCLLGYRSGLCSVRWQLCFMFSAILLPYMFFICLGALFAAVLNVFGKFSLAASSSIWLNLSMIGALVIGHFFADTWHIYLLCGGVLLGGVIQMGSLWWGLGRHGWKFRFNLVDNGRIGEVQRLFLPGAMGASMVQINIAVSRALAHIVSDNAVSILYLANRLIELPLGLFVVAVTTVIFPRLSQLEVRGQKSLLGEEFRRGMFWILMIIFPATLGLFGLDRTLLSLLFIWGNFTAKDMALVLPVFRILLIALPFYALSALLLRGYHCKKNTTWPLVIAIFHFAVNIILTIGFMFSWQSVGIAFANLLSVLLQTLLLYWGLRRLYEELRIKLWTKRFRNIVLASILMGIVVRLSDYALSFYLSGKAHGLVSLGINIPMGVAFYFGLLYLFEGRKPLRDWRIFWERLAKKLRKTGHEL